MRAIETITDRVAVLMRDDVDTDQIIPKQFLKRVERTGFGQFLFYDWRYAADGSPDPAFVLNEPTASRTRTAAERISGPMPSPGSVTM